jgi:Transposase DDE domain
MTRSAGSFACSIQSSSGRRLRFMQGFSKQCEGVVAIDGKVLRRSFGKASGKSPLPMACAWGCEQRLVLAQIATDAKSNEITAVPKLLEMLTQKGTIVTADALNCQRAIAGQIVDQGGDYPFGQQQRPLLASNSCT